MIVIRLKRRRSYRNPLTTLLSVYVVAGSFVRVSRVIS